MTDQLSDQDYEQALKRIRAFTEQVERSEKLADEGSLDIARDLAAVFADGRWADDLPPVKRSHVRGRPIDPLGRSRFATWARDPERSGGWAPRTVYRFLNAARVAEEFLDHGQTIHATEASLRPLTSLLAKGQADLIGPAWERARQAAHGEPSGTDVKAAVAALRPAPARGARSATASAPTDWSETIFAEFERHLLKTHRLRDAGMLLIRMKDAYDKARAADD